MNILKRLEDYYSLKEEDQEKILDELLVIANKDPEKFKTSIQNIHPEEEEHLPVVYEALARDTKKWGPFFVEEAQRIIDLARDSPKPYQILNLLDEFVFIDRDDFEQNEQFVEILKKELDNEHPTFRYIAVSLLPDFVCDSDVKTIELLKERLHDKDWRVRYWAFHNLKDHDDLPADLKRSLLDLIRSKMSNPLKFD